MAYQAKRKGIYTEDFELTEEDGTVVHTLHVALDPDNMARKLSEKHLELARALRDVQDVRQGSTEEEKARGLEVLGRAVTDLLEAVFGPEDAETIIGFYDGRYVEMCREVVPFITGVVIPKVREMARDNRKAVLNSYNRSQRRLLRRRKL